MANKIIKINIFNLAEKWQKKHNENLSLRKLSRETGIRHNTLINYRDNKMKDVSVKNLISLLQFFKCNLNELISYEEE